MTAEQAWQKAVEQKRSIEDRGYETPCWVFTKGATVAGYGQAFVNGKVTLLHRLAVLVSGRTIPPKHDVDHLCRVTRCFRPDHLEVVTHQINTQRGVISEVTKARFAAMETCKNGHPRTPENIYETTQRRGYPHRMCRACNAERKRRYRAQKA